MEFNRKRFGSESDYTDEQFCQEVRDFFHVVALLGNIQTLVVKKEGVLVGVEVAVVYKNNYYVLNGGYDATLSNLGKFLIFKHLEQCFTLQCDDFDLLVGDTGWKELWNMHKEPCFTFEKKSHPNLYST
jgi:CelD/BcsL family acetyltransferase involved in cellulose biosynthesis